MFHAPDHIHINTHFPPYAHKCNTCFTVTANEMNQVNNNKKILMGFCSNISASCKLDFKFKLKSWSIPKLANIKLLIIIKAEDQVATFDLTLLN